MEKTAEYTQLDKRRIRRRISVCSVVLVVVAVFVAADKAQSNELLRFEVPLGLPSGLWGFYVPRSNPLTPEKIALGRELFFDKRLSGDGTVSCADCHDPNKGFADGRVKAEGIGGKTGTRNSPTVLNAVFNPGQFWDGRAETLEEQAPLPLINPLEMGNRSYDEVIQRIRVIPEYRVAFRRAFGKEPAIDDLAKAIACFERTLVAADSPLDRFIAGEQSALSEQARRGFALFRGRARCSRCHTFNDLNPFFTDFSFHNTGVAANHSRFDDISRRAYAVAEREGAKAAIDTIGREEGGDELGRMLFSYQVFDLGSFRTPSLRNVSLTAPYFHDGSAKTLNDVVRFYNDGGKQNLNREWELNSLNLSESDQRDLVAFLESLTGRIPR